MQGIRVLLLISGFFVCALPAAFAQDESATGAEAEDAEVTAEDATEADAASDVPDTDDESYRDIDDEDFTPSEEIPADQSIAFPTDI